MLHVPIRKQKWSLKAKILSHVMVRMDDEQKYEEKEAKA
jgi:hypothetical protein